MFEAYINTKILKDALSMVASTVGKNGGTVGSNSSNENVYLSTDGKGGIEILTSNGIESSAVTMISSTTNGSKIPAACVAPLVDYKRFTQVINSIPAEDISIKEDARKNLEISYSSNVKPTILSFCNASPFMVPNNINGVLTFIIPTDAVSDAVKAASKFIKENTDNPAYGCLRIEVDGTDVDITGIDINGFRNFYQHNTSNNLNNKNILLVEISKLKKALKMFDEFLDLRFDSDGHVIMISGINNKNPNSYVLTSTFYIRCLGSNNFPTKIRSIFESTVSNWVTFNRESMMASLERMMAIKDSVAGFQGFDILSDATGRLVVSFDSCYGSVCDNIPTKTVIPNGLNCTLLVPTTFELLSLIPDEDVMMAPCPINNQLIILKGGTNASQHFSIAKLIRTTTP